MVLKLLFTHNLSDLFATIAGEIVTLISVDVERIWLGLLYTHWLWAGPMMAVIAMVLLIMQTGEHKLGVFVVTIQCLILTFLVMECQEKLFFMISLLKNCLNSDSNFTILLQVMRAWQPCSA